ncbi:hypothetical protein BJV82DRAFT_667847 [Fennellomyces sp. T-0311]|nr:hypothetical protein BJV82DRAFT_667847 [Fennellomyces sp. T-0311]
MSYNPNPNVPGGGRLNFRPDPFECSCGATFTRGYSMKVHIRQNPSHSIVRGSVEPDMMSTLSPASAAMSMEQTPPVPSPSVQMATDSVLGHPEWEVYSSDIEEDSHEAPNDDAEGFVNQIRSRFEGLTSDEAEYMLSEFPGIARVLALGLAEAEEARQQEDIERKAAEDGATL